MLESPRTLTFPILLGSLSLASKVAWEVSTIPLSRISTSKFLGDNTFTGSTSTDICCSLSHKWKKLYVLRDYGVLIEEAGIALRGLFIVDPSGVLRFCLLEYISNKLIFNHRDCFIVFTVHASGKCQSTTCLSAEVWMKLFVLLKLSSLWRKMGR